MSKQIVNQFSFNAGRISPLLEGRQDIAQYSRALSEADNATVSSRGPVSRRKGFEYIANVKTKTSNIRLVPYQVSDTSAFILEFGENYIRFYKDGAQVESSPSVPLEVTTTYSSAQVDDIWFVQRGVTLYISHKDKPLATLVRTSDTVWTLADFVYYPAPTTEDGHKPTAILTPGATTGTGVTFTTTTTGVFLASDVGRQIINLSGAGRASITSIVADDEVVVDIIEDFPSTSNIPSQYWKLDLSPISELTASALSRGSIVTVTSDDIGTATAINTFRTVDVGKYIVMNGGVIQINKYVSASEVTGEVQKSLNSLDETAIWTLEEEIFSSANGYPEFVTFHQQRLVLASSSSNPNTLWLSESGDLQSFGVGPDDEDSISVDLSTTNSTSISWVLSSRDLLIGTLGGESAISGTASGSAITPSNIFQTQRTSYGSAKHQPELVAGEVIFKQIAGRKLRSIQYDFSSDGYLGNDLTLLAEDISEGKIDRIIYVENPDPLIIATDEAGDLLVCAYDKSQQVVGWSKWSTNGTVEDVQTITTSSTDEVWAVVSRTINGTAEKYIERLYSGDSTSLVAGFSDSFFSDDSPVTVSGITQANPGVVTATGHGFSDGDRVKLFEVGGMTEVIGKTYVVANKTTNTFELTLLNGTNVDTSGFTAYTSGGKVYKLFNSVSGLDHLEGEEVIVITDGASHPAKTVSSGSITLDNYYYNVVVGLSYETKLVTVSIDSNGVGQGQRQKKQQAILRVDRSVIPTLNGSFKPRRNTNDVMDARPVLTTGDLVYHLSGWDRSGKLTITTSEGLPLTLLAIYGSSLINPV